jgi:hypothetical protein
MMEGFAVAALAQGDADGARALPGLTTEAGAELAGALRGLSRTDADTRRRFLRSSLARPAIDPRWSARLTRPEPALLAYLAQLSRQR